MDQILQNTDQHFGSDERRPSSDSQMGRIIERSLNEVYLFDAETFKFVQVNAGARSNLGYSLDELKNLTPLDIKPEFCAEDFDELVQPLRDGTIEKVVFETLHQRKDGSTYNVEVHLQLMKEGSASLFTAIALDITKHKETEEELRIAVMKSDQANRAKSEFLANMSHELRTPLNSVIGFSEMICREIHGPVQNEKYREFIDEIHRSGTNLLNLINDILDLSKIETGEMELNEGEIEICQAILSCRRVINERAEEATVALDFEIDDSLPTVFADNRAIKQIIQNLLSNAVKFTGPGGVVTLRTGLTEEGDLKLSVSDTGIGIEETQLRKVLKPFNQTDGVLTRKKGGAGLGLPLVISLLELHGGTFELQSRMGVGTKATITLPAFRVLDSSVGANRAS